MRDRAGTLGITAAGGIGIVALVWLSTLGGIFLVLAAVLAAFLAALGLVGMDRVGVGLLVAGYFAAPLNALRPISAVDLVTYSDLLLVAAFACLLPRILGARTHAPPTFLIGSLVMIATGAVASLASAEPLASLGYLLRLVSAAVLLPFLLTRSCARRQLVDALAWAYVAGQTVSTAYALVAGTVGNRYGGLTTHPNFYGMCAALAGALCLYLLGRTRRDWIWVPAVLLLVSVLGVLLSGSRASLLGIGAVIVLVPLVERSGRAGYVLLAATVILVVLSNTGAFSYLGEGTAINRLEGTESAVNSDLRRTEMLQAGWDTFLERPTLGTGLSLETTFTHNGYLEIAGALGIFGLAGYLAILATLAGPVLRRPKPDRLAYVALTYCIISTFNNTLWDRFAWTVIALPLVSLAEHRGPRDDPDATSSEHRGERQGFVQHTSTAPRISGTT